MWEILKHFTLKGEKVKMWQGKDAEGRRIFSVAHEEDLYQPGNGVYTQKAAKEAYLENMEFIKKLKEAGDL